MKAEIIWSQNVDYGKKKKMDMCKMYAQKWRLKWLKLNY